MFFVTLARTFSTSFMRSMTSPASMVTSSCYILIIIIPLPLLPVQLLLLIIIIIKIIIKIKIIIIIMIKGTFLTKIFENVYLFFSKSEK